jgi:heme oxygenase (biliverdin-IX-beta and delta-forming)
MDADTSALLARLIREVRIAALGTLRQGGPLVSMVSFLPEADFGAVCLRVSRLAWHTQDMLADPRVSLSIVESDDGRADPQTLARVTLRGEAQPLAREGEPYERLKTSWLERFPASAVTFALADFSFWRLVPLDARFVAGLGRTYNLSAEALRRAAI